MPFLYSSKLYEFTVLWTSLLEFQFSRRTPDLSSARFVLAFIILPFLPQIVNVDIGRAVQK